MLGRLWLLALALPGAGLGQFAISIQAGLVSHMEGAVLLDGRNPASAPNELLQLSQGQRLATADGKAEVVLTPECILRLAPDSEIRLRSGELTNVQLELLQGAVAVDCRRSPRTPVEIRVAGAPQRLETAGRYRFGTDADPFDLWVKTRRAAIKKLNANLERTQRRPVAGF